MSNKTLELILNEATKKIGAKVLSIDKFYYFLGTRFRFHRKHKYIILNDMITNKLVKMNNFKHITILEKKEEGIQK